MFFVFLVFRSVYKIFKSPTFSGQSGYSCRCFGLFMWKFPLIWIFSDISSSMARSPLPSPWRFPSAVPSSSSPRSSWLTQAESQGAVSPRATDNARKLILAHHAHDNLLSCLPPCRHVGNSPPAARLLGGKPPSSCLLLIGAADRFLIFPSPCQHLCSFSGFAGGGHSCSLVQGSVRGRGRSGASSGRAIPFSLAIYICRPGGCLVEV